MGILSTEDSRSFKASAGKAINTAMKKSNWKRMVRVVFFVLAAIAFGCWTAVGRAATILHSVPASQETGNLPRVPSASSLKPLLARFDRAYMHTLQASTAGRYSRYRPQLRNFLMQAKALKGDAEADYQRDMENSRDAQKSSLELSMVVDALSTVGRILDGPQNARSRAKLAQQTRLWLPRLEVGLEQDKTMLDFSRKFSKRAFAGQKDLSNPYALYSQVTVCITRAKSQLSAGDSLGAWLSVAQADMLVGNLAMRLPPSASM